MVEIEKSQPAPDCLDTQKKLANGDYKCGDVLERTKTDFHNKCYICEYKEPNSINVEHFTPHEGNKELKFDWNNLFYACSHCNNTKLANFQNILNCTTQDSGVETKMRYTFKPFPFEKVEIEVLEDSPEVRETRDLLLSVYNGTTKLKTIEASNIRERLLDEMREFQNFLIDYFDDTISDEDKEYILIKVKSHINVASNFAAIKRWIIRDNPKLHEELGEFL